MSEHTNKFKIDDPDSSTFDFSHLHRTSGDMGKLIPIHCQVTLPGDKIVENDVIAFVRGMPTIKPILDKVDIKINHFYVPYRVLWNKWEQYYTKSDTWKYLGESEPLFPVVESTAFPANPNYPTGRLADYLGVSKYYTNKGKISPLEAVSAFPFLAYNKIYLDYFVPQRWLNYGDNEELTKLKQFSEACRTYNGGSLGNHLGEDESLINTRFKLRNVGWNHDYFTNALPTPELFEGSKILLSSASLAGFTAGYIVTPSQVGIGELNPNGSTLDENGYSNYQKLPVVRDLRNSIAKQHYLDKLSYGGGRYEETTKLLWNQDLKTSMLQRSQYLGGDVVPLFVNEVESTASTDGADLGELGGKPIGAGTARGEYFECDEFGIYMITAHIVPKRSYSDAMSKSLFFTTNVDELPNPDFQGIGDEAVFRYEVDGISFSDANQDKYLQTWGYVPRYSQWKSQIDRFSGELRTSLKDWHLGNTAESLQNFNTISPEFIKCNPRTDIFLLPNEPDKFIMSFNCQVKINRKLAFNPMPGISYI